MRPPPRRPARPGALADWFAVTALFKHPLGIPIPHTAMIQPKKDQLGAGLPSFVRENFDVACWRLSRPSCATPKSRARLGKVAR